MIFANHFSPTSHPCVVGPYVKSITYVTDLRFAIPGEKLSACFQQAASDANSDMHLA